MNKNWFKENWFKLAIAIGIGAYILWSIYAAIVRHQCVWHTGFQNYSHCIEYYGV